MHPTTPNLRRDLRVALALALAAFAVGSVYTATWGGTAHFFQELFGPAVMFACGRGWENPVVADAPALHAFLHPPMHVDHPPTVDACDCAALPADLATQPWESFQRRQRYLIHAVGLLWRATGVSWAALAPLNGALHAASALALFALFRLAAGPWLAGVATWLMLLSPIQLHHLPRLRDYSKAPFLLAGIAILGWMLLRARTPRRLLGGAAALGLVAGVGVGFRMDVIMLLPPALVVIALFAPRAAGGLRVRAAAMLLCLAAYYGVSWPVTRALETGMKYQDFLLGLNDLYDSRLGTGDAPYQVGHRYLDREPMAILQAHALHRGEAAPHFEFDTVAYERIGRDYTLRLLATMPADLQLRAGAAILRTLDELTFSTRHAVPRGIEGTLTRGYFEAQAALAAPVLRHARHAAVLALALIAAHSLRLGFGTLFLLAFFGGYGAIQFASRHYFHMQFLSLWVVLVLLAAALAWRPGQRPTRAHATRAALFAASVLALWFGSMAVLRGWQARQLAPLQQAVADAPWMPLAVESSPEGDETVLLRGNEGAGMAAFPVDAAPPHFAFEYLALDVTPGPAGANVEFAYAASIPDLALTWAAQLPPGDAPTRIVFPAYHAMWKGADAGWTRFEGLRLPAAIAQTARLSRHPAPETLPLHFTWFFPPEWERQPLRQRLTR